MQNTGSVNSKERPILFNSEMVNAILSGRKTQTRRIMKVQPQVTERRLRELGAWQDGFNLSQQVNAAFQAGFIDVSCPLGKPGDQLWVRETFALLGNEDGVCVDWKGNLIKSDEQDAARIYKASCEQKHGDYGLYSIPDSAYWKPDTSSMKYEGSWRPSIHMPRWASRINLLITGVRVERLNDISEKDALAEGVSANEHSPARYVFGSLWQSIYGADNPKSWQANPWVWVIEFERMEAK